MSALLQPIEGQEVSLALPEATGLAERHGLVWQAQFVDETTGAGVSVPVQLSTPDPTLKAVAAPGGLAGLVARPDQDYPLIDVLPVPLEVRAEAPGFLPIDLNDTIVAAPDHPEGFTPAGPVSAVQMRPRAVRLSGRVVRRGPAGLTPVVGATVVLDGIWPVEPATGGAPLAPPVPTARVEVRPGLPGLVASGATLRRVTIAATPTATVLARGAPAGSTEIVLADRSGLAVGQFLRLEGAHPDRAEVLRIDALAPVPPLPFGGQVSLTTPTGFAHASGVSVERVTATVAGPVRALTQEAYASQGSLTVDDAAGLTTSGWLRIGPAAAGQIRRVRSFSVTTDADGAFRLPPLEPPARVFLTAFDGISALPDPAIWAPARDGPDDWLDIELPP